MSDQVASDDWSDPHPEILAALERAEKLIGVVVALRPKELPEGTRLVKKWRPLDRDDVATTSVNPGALANPWVAGRGRDAEVRLLLEVGSGRWLELMQGVRGDVGDLPAKAVRLEDGNAATVFDVLGGYFVQWSRADVSYAAFGVGLRESDVLRVAGGLTAG